MESLYLLVPLGVLAAAIIGASFWIAVMSGQFEDLEASGREIVEDEPR